MSEEKLNIIEVLLKFVKLLIILFIIAILGVVYQLFGPKKRKRMIQDNIIMTIDGKKEPPPIDQDVDESTLAGIDTDNNGVRDDLDRYINRFYLSPESRRRARDLARSAQKIITSTTHDRKEMQKMMFKHIYNDICLGAYYKDFKYQPDQDQYLFHSIPFNTDAREERFDEVSRTARGMMIPSCTAGDFGKKECLEYCDKKVE